jgi:hypothetical protein
VLWIVMSLFWVLIVVSLVRTISSNRGYLSAVWVIVARSRALE